MSASANDRKVAILLTAIGGEAVDPALSAISDSAAASIRQAITEMETSPPDDAEREEVLDEFEKFFRFALETANVPATWMQDMLDKETESSGDKRTSEAAQIEDDPDEQEPLRLPALKLFKPTDDPFYDLGRLKPVQLARVLRAEQPRTIALVMDHLTKEKTSEVIRNLPESLQTEVILEMRNRPSAPDVLVERIVLETVRIASAVSDSVVDETDINDELAQMLRSMPKKERARIMNELTETNPETAEEISARLYIFDDITNYNDRSIQKLLGEVDTVSLVASLQGADEAILELVLNNLSKRARGAILEEMELSPELPEEDVKQAREKVAAAIAHLDREGQLVAR